MPLENKITQITNNIQSFFDENKLTSFSNITSGAVDLFVNFQRFRKLIAQCSTKDGTNIDDVIEEIRNFAEEGYEHTSFHKNPEKITCFVTAIIGLGTFFNEQVKEIKKQLSTYKKGFLPYLDNVWRDIFKEFNPGKFGEEFEKQVEILSSNITDMGVGLISEYVSDTIVNAENYIDEGLKRHFSKIGTYFSFLMVISNEFKWATYLIFIENLKTQITTRIDNLIVLKNSIRNLIYEIDLNNQDIGSLSPQSLENYIAALTLLEETVNLNRNIEKDIKNINLFNKIINDGIINNLGESKKLLLNQRNTFLLNLIKGKKSINDLEFLDSTLVYNLILPNDIIERDDLYILDSTLLETNESKLLQNLKEISGIFIEESKERIEYTTNPYLNGFSKINTLWLEIRSPISDATFIKIGKRILKFKNQLVVDPTLHKAESKFDDKLSSDPIYFIELEIINQDIYSNSFAIMNSGYLQKYFLLELDIDYSVISKPVDIEINNDSYTIKENETNEQINTIVFNNIGLTKIKEKWEDRTDWVGILILKYEINDEPKYNIMHFTGELPTFPDHTKNETENVVNELPEPMNTLFNKFKNFNGELGDYSNISGELSNFLFGKDIINGPFDKWGNYLNSYSKFISTSSDVLEVFCPLKNSIFTFYSLLEQISVLGNKYENIAGKISKDWILKLNLLIENTIRVMTNRDSDGNFSTIEEIKNSTIYYKLIPSLLLDYDNINNLEKLAKLNDTLGGLFNNNSLLESKFKEYKDFSNWMLETDKLNVLKNTEQEMWALLGTTFVNSLKLILKGERVSNLKLSFDNIERKTDDLIIALSDVSDRLQLLNIESFESQNSLIKLLSDLGLKHFVEYIKNGDVDIFIKEKIGLWMGKYGPTIGCLNTLANKFFTGQEKNYLLSVSNYLHYIDIGELLSLVDTESLNMDSIIDINFVNKVSNETINNLKSTIKKANASLISTKILEKKSSDKQN